MTKQKRKVVFLLAGVVTFLVAGLLFWSEVWGVEFSPDLFAHRSYQYNTIFGVQVTTKSLNQYHSELDQYLHDAGYITKIAQDKPRWHLVKEFRGGYRNSRSGDAKDLCKALGCFSGDEKRWVTWSKANPELAAVVWPQVIRWARSEKYARIWEFIIVAELESRAVSENEPASPIVKLDQTDGK